VAAAAAVAEPRADADPDGAEAVRLAADPAAEAREPTAGRALVGLAAADVDAWAGATLAALRPSVAPPVPVGSAAWTVAAAAWPTPDGVAASDPTGDEPAAPEPDGAEATRAE
jgi:hypothetical protein